MELDEDMKVEWNEVYSRAIRIPPWFSCGQARAVLELKGGAYVVISGARGAYRVASREQLAAARPDQAVTGASVLLGSAVVRRRSDGRRESDRRAGARARSASVRVEDARDVADEHLAERREGQLAGVQIELNQTVALEAA